MTPERGFLHAFILGLLLPSTLVAAPSEIKVFTDELAKQGEHTFETHVNKANRGPLRFMPEYSYGIRRDWEFSLQLPAAADDGQLHMPGVRAELQYVAPHDEDEGFYWGFNVEAAKRSLELVPILGFRSERWHFAANPGVEKSRSNVDFQPAAKVAYRTSAKNYFGVECFGEQTHRVLYLAWDGKLGKSDLNVGVGRGLNSVSDRWVAKAVYEFAF
jgi:hypothetical protein